MENENSYTRNFISYDMPTMERGVLPGRRIFERPFAYIIGWERKT